MLAAGLVIMHWQHNAREGIIGAPPFWAPFFRFVLGLVSKLDTEVLAPGEAWASSPPPAAAGLNATSATFFFAIC